MGRRDREKGWQYLREWTFSCASANLMLLMIIITLIGVEWIVFSFFFYEESVWGWLGSHGFLWLILLIVFFIAKALLQRIFLNILEKRRLRFEVVYKKQLGSVALVCKDAIRLSSYRGGALLSLLCALVLLLPIAILAHPSVLVSFIWLVTLLFSSDILLFGFTKNLIGNVLIIEDKDRLGFWIVKREEPLGD